MPPEGGEGDPMSAIAPIDVSKAPAASLPLLERVKAKLGATPNMMRALAHSPAALEGYLAFSGALGKGSFDAAAREQIALAVGEQNDCAYCVAAHSVIGRKAGLGEDAVADARRGRAADPRTAGALALARTLVERSGRVGPEDVAAARAAGLDDAALAEVVGLVSLNIYTNYFNHVAGTPVDFPAAPPLS
jgi:uncharacterized peroxidase-related enzyme